MQNNLVSILFLILFTSCLSSSEKESDHKLVKALNPNKALQIDLDGAQYDNDSYQLINNSKGQDVLYGLDKFKKRINIYNLSRESYEGYIDFSAEKSNINEVHQFYVINKDSIMLFSTPSNTLYLVNETGDLTNKWQLDFNYDYNDVLNEYDFGVLTAVSDYNSFFEFDNTKNKLYFSLAFYNGTNFLNKDVYKFPPLGVLNLTDSSQLLETVGAFPANYTSNDIPFDICYNFTLVEGKPMASFQYSSQFFFKDEWLDAQSAFDEQEYESYDRYNADPTSEEQLAGYNMDFAYVRNLFDSVNNTILRICKHQQEPVNGDGLYNQYIQSDWSLLKYDLKQKNTLTEYIFPKNIYDFRWVFTRNDGIYIIRENPFNESNIEDKLEIDFFEL